MQAPRPLQALTITLQKARKASRLSQLELSLRMGISQRHISFVESGRSKPSRALLLAWLQVLEAPLTVRNAALLQAGFAPAYSAALLSSHDLAQANEALSALLNAHDPMPALVIDAHWNLVRSNQGASWLMKSIMPWITTDLLKQPINMLDSLANPDGLAKTISNFHEIGPILLARLRDEATVVPELKPKVEAFALLVKQKLSNDASKPIVSSENNSISSPMMTTRFNTSHGELSFFTMFTTFGTPQDITLASLRVEHLFAADETTRKILRDNASLTD
jgi:transcriptional regulator with XRE-family HTH domain